MIEEPEIQICKNIYKRAVGNMPHKTPGGTSTVISLWTIMGYPTWAAKSPDQKFLDVWNKRDLKKCKWSHLMPNWGMTEGDADQFIKDYNKMLKEHNNATK